MPDAVASHRPDVVLMDLQMPRVDGVTATRRLRRAPGAPVVVVLTTFDADDNVVAALEAGASGFLLKDTPPERIVAAVHQAASGEPILSPAITQRLVSQKLASAAVRKEALTALAALTDRESHGGRRGRPGSHPTPRSPGSCSSASATVKAHVSSILAKLALDNRTQLALLAARRRAGLSGR